MSDSSPVPPVGEALSSSAQTQGIKPQVIHVAKCKCLLPLSGRNLVVCIDGTASQFGQDVRTTFSVPSNFLILAQNSNVVELYSRLIKDKKQLTYYNSGIGTYMKGSRARMACDTRFLLHLADLFFAMCVFFHNPAACPHVSSLLLVPRNFRSHVLKAYQWLSENYEDGDRIFLFGWHPPFCAVLGN